MQSSHTNLDELGFVLALPANIASLLTELRTCNITVILFTDFTLTQTQILLNLILANRAIFVFQFRGMEKANVLISDLLNGDKKFVPDELGYNYNNPDSQAFIIRVRILSNYLLIFKRTSQGLQRALPLRRHYHNKLSWVYFFVPTI